MAQFSDEEQDPNDIVSSRSLTLQTTNTTKQRLISSTGTLTSPPPLPTLTFDLIAEILCRLPVKLLIQLQCLGKYWKSLISDPKFAKKHLQSSIKRHHLMVSSTNNLNDFVLYDSEISCVFSSTCIVKQTQINYPVTVTPQKNGYREPSSLCSCDGILCFAIDPTSAILWNPSIRKLELLPPLGDNPQRRVIFSTYSFGYDHFIDNYKIIVVNFCIGQNEVSVNTMGTDYWRRIHDDFPFYGPVHRPGVFVSGTVNWLAYDASSSHSCAIVSLDLEKESYQKLSHPDLENDADMRTLGVVRDCLCIFASNDMFLDVWIMNEYGNKESWTKLYSVPYIKERGFRIYTKDLYFSEDDQLLINLYNSGSNELELAVYDSKNGTLRIPQIQNIDRSMDPEVYIESLISPCS
jgi:F-box interacting protein